MPGTKSFLFCSLISLPLLSMVACAATEQDSSQAAPVYFSDCGVVNLQGADGRHLTREELIAAEDRALLEALDDNSECNQKALAAGQQAVAAAGAGAGSGQGQGSGTGQNGQQNSAANGQNPQDSSTQQQSEQVITSNTGVGGGKSGVEGKEITVCQISRENLAASTTPEDREFWQGEVDKNCN